MLAIHFSVWLSRYANTITHVLVQDIELLRNWETPGTHKLLIVRMGFGD